MLERPEPHGRGSGLMSDGAEHPRAANLRPPLVIVLCGGTSRRLAGRDKTRELLGGTTVMDHLLDALPPGWPVVCVGEERATTRFVRWCRESPAGGGPVAGIAAALRHAHQLSDVAAFEICLVAGGDMPFAGPAVPLLADALNAAPRLDAVVAVDPDGRTQPLLAAYRRDALWAALPAESAGARLMGVLDSLHFDTLACEPSLTLDVDTPEALAEARHIVGA
jgi:molybdopterin-guanine dinucleotide biosynthesis protein A